MSEGLQDGDLIYDPRDGYFHPIKVTKIKITLPPVVFSMPPKTNDITADWGRYGAGIESRDIWATITS